VPVRSINRGEIIKAADLAVERRPKADTADAIALSREAIGRAARVALRFSQPIRRTDLVTPELVKRDENVTLVYQAPGLLLTSRGKALEGGGEGDVINVLNVQSNSTVKGTMAGPGRVEIAAATVRPNPFQPQDESITNPE
jgi:flagellar basal body P-ring formation protein FlgA